LPGRAETFGAQVLRFREVFASLDFWRICLPLVICHATYQAMQGLWLAPWLYDVAGAGRGRVANYLFTAALAYAIGSVAFGATSDRLAQLGISRMTVYKTGLGLSFAMFVLLAAGVTQAPRVDSRGLRVHRDLGRARLCATDAAVSPRDDRPAQHGFERADVCVLVCIPMGHRRSAAHFPVVDGRFAAEGYALAFGFLAAAQAAVLLWLLPMGEPFRRGRLTRWHPGIRLDAGSEHHRENRMYTKTRRHFLFSLSAVAAAVAAGFPVRAAMGPNDKFDLVVKGGTVLDPSQKLNAKRDIGMRFGVIEAIEADIPAARAQRVLDATGRTVFQD
jgi:hypothetical protein